MIIFGEFLLWFSNENEIWFLFLELLAFQIFTRFPTIGPLSTSLRSNGEPLGQCNCNQKLWLSQNQNSSNFRQRNQMYKIDNFYLILLLYKESQYNDLLPICQNNNFIVNLCILFLLSTNPFSMSTTLEQFICYETTKTHILIVSEINFDQLIFSKLFSHLLVLSPRKDIEGSLSINFLLLPHLHWRNSSSLFWDKTIFLGNLWE